MLLSHLQLSRGFGRIADEIKPYSVSLPLPISTATVPPDGVDREVPHLDCSYCAPGRHCLSNTTSLPAFLGFQRGDVP